MIFSMINIIRKFLPEASKEIKQAFLRAPLKEKKMILHEHANDTDDALWRSPQWMYIEENMQEEGMQQGGEVMKKDQFGHGGGSHPDPIGYIMSDKGDELVEKTFHAYGSGKLGRSVIMHFIETGQYIPSEQMTESAVRAIKSLKYDTSFARHDWIDEKFRNLEKVYGKPVSHSKKQKAYATINEEGMQQGGKVRKFGY